jgi:DNA-binding response OmpR family regulator
MLELEGFDAVVIGNNDKALHLFEAMNPDMVIIEKY